MGMSNSTKHNPTYSNFWSRLLLRPFFEDQFVIPPPPPRWLEIFLIFYERYLLKIDTSAIDIDRPIFLLGLPRTGSSMLQDLLCTHPDLAYISHAMHAFRRCFCGADRFRRLFRLNVKGLRFLDDSVEVEAGSPADPVAFWCEWLKEDPYQVECRDYSLKDFSPDEIEALRNSLRRVIWCFGGRANRYFCKNPALLPHVYLLRDIFPDAKFVFLVREPGPTANSLIKLFRLGVRQEQIIYQRRGENPPSGRAFIPYPRLPRLPEYLQRFGSDDLRTTARLWRDSALFIARALDKLDSALLIRYEDLCADPEGEISKILQYCGLPEFAPDNRDYGLKLSRVGRTGHRNVYGGFDLVREICGPVMPEFGYK
jgi:hypothetical protein